MGADDGVGRVEMNEGGGYFSSGFRAIGEGVDLRVPVRRLKGEDRSELKTFVLVVRFSG